jgi:hypothetical protein
MEKKKLVRSKVTGRAAANEGAAMSAIVNVREPGYQPAGVDIRKWIAADIFTANLLQPDLERLEKDSRVISVALNKPEQMIR